VFINDVPFFKKGESIQAVPQLKVLLQYEIAAHKSNDFSRADRALGEAVAACQPGPGNGAGPEANPGNLHFAPYYGNKHFLSI